MKIRNALKLPFSVVADIATLGNFGEGSHTGRVIRSDEQERELERLLDVAERVSRILDRRR